jgi:hypothetical protein
MIWLDIIVMTASLAILSTRCWKGPMTDVAGLWNYMEMGDLTITTVLLQGQALEIA